MTKFEINAGVFGSNGKVKNVTKSFKTEEAREAWVEKMEDEGKLYQVFGYREID